MKNDLCKSKNFIIQLVCLCVISCFFLTLNINTAAAQRNHPNVEGRTETKNEKVQSQAWQPPPPPPDDFDWIQLDSGKWLKGELKTFVYKTRGSNVVD